MTAAIGFLSNVPTGSNGLTFAEELKVAIDRGDLDAIQKSEYPINQPLPSGHGLPLAYAIEHDHSELVEPLLAKGADPALRKEGLPTAIEVAILKKNEEVLKSLLGHAAARSMQEVEETLSHPVDRNEVKKAVETIQKDFSPKQRSQLGKTVKNNLDLGEFNKIDKNSTTLLHLAIQSGSLDLLRECLENSRCKELLINRPDARGYTPLHHAMALENLDMVKLLSFHGADSRIQDAKGLKPLMLLGGKAEENHPNHVSDRQSTLALYSAALWLARSSYIAIQIPSYVYPFLGGVEAILPISLLFNEKDVGIKQGLIQLAVAALSVFMAFQSDDGVMGTAKMVYTAALAGTAAYSALKGLATCWKHRALGIGQSIKRAVIVEAPKLVNTYKMIHSIGSTLGKWKPFAGDVISRVKAKLFCSVDSFKFDDECLSDEARVAVACELGAEEVCTAASESFNMAKERIELIEEAEREVYLKIEDQPSVYNTRILNQISAAKSACGMRMQESWDQLKSSKCETEVARLSEIKNLLGDYQEVEDKCLNKFEGWLDRLRCVNLGDEKIYACKFGDKKECDELTNKLKDLIGH